MSRFYVAILTSIVFAQLNAGCQSIPEEDKIIAKHIEARGGLEKLQSIQTVKMTGQYNFNGVERPLTIYKMRPNLFRLEISVDGKNVVLVYDGDQAWELNELRSNEVSEIEDQRSLNFVQRNADFDGALINHDKKGHTVEYLGTENVDGTTSLVLQVTSQEGRVENWYLDQSTYLVVQRTMKLPHPYDPNEEDMTQVFFYLDHQPVNGIRFPHYMEREDMQYVREHVIKHVELNSEIDPALFAMANSEKSQSL